LSARRLILAAGLALGFGVAALLVAILLVRVVLGLSKRALSPEIL
jgi:hypothetical protein